MTEIKENAPSQIVHPWITSARTAVQVALSLLLGIAGTVITLATIAPDVLNALIDILPPEATAYIAGAIAGLTALATALTRLFAIPAVNEWLKKIGLGVPDTETAP